MEGGCTGNPNSASFAANNNNNNNMNNNGSLSSIMMMMNHNSQGITNTTTTTDDDDDHHHHHHHHHDNNLTDSKLFHQLPLMTMMMPPQQQQEQATNHDLICNSIKAKIMAHPHFPRLLSSYVSCQKVGAPAPAVARLEEACASGEVMSRSAAAGGGGHLGQDPALDQFMEAYCEMLSKYEQELTKPFQEALLFLSDIDSKLKTLTLLNPSNNLSAGQSGSSEEEIDGNEHHIDPLAEDGELKGQLLRRYSGSLGSLKQEFMKKKKKGKLPKEARQQLLDWWSRHHRWPYPSEPQKLALAESTGLDPKQINNWFINQRKRHWKPSEDMQFVVMDATYPQFYMENGMGNPFPMEFNTPAHF